MDGQAPRGELANYGTTAVAAVLCFALVFWRSEGARTLRNSPAVNEFHITVLRVLRSRIDCADHALAKRLCTVEVDRKRLGDLPVEARINQRGEA